MDESEKARLAQTLKSQLAHIGQPVVGVAPVHPAFPLDLTPFAIAACVATAHLRRHVDDAMRDADPAWDASTAISTLLQHPVLRVLGLEEAVAAHRLAAVALVSGRDPAARACLDEVVRHGWHRVWQTVSAGETVSLERFRELHRGEGRQDLDAELIVLVWYAGVCGVPVAESPGLEALNLSLVRETHRLTVAASDVGRADRSPYDAVTRYVAAWRRAIQGDCGDHELVARLAGARSVVEHVTHRSDEPPLTQSDIWQAALLLAGANAQLDDGTAVSMLAGLHALRQGSVIQIPVQGRPIPANEAGPHDEDLGRARRELAAQQREVHRLTGELDRARERLSARDAEISRLLGGLSARDEPEPEVQYAVKTIGERILVAGGHETLSRNLQAWLPNSICIATNGKEDLDRSVLADVRLVVVLTSYISHSFSGKVVSEAHKRDVPVIYLDWRSAKHILQEIDRALSARQDAAVTQ